MKAWPKEERKTITPGWQHDALAGGGRTRTDLVASDWHLIATTIISLEQTDTSGPAQHRWNPDTKQVDPADGSGDWYYLQEDGDLQGACWHSKTNGAMEVWYVEK